MGFRRYVDFRGRSTRAEFWWFLLFLWLTSYVLTAVEGSLTGTSVLGSGFRFAIIVPMIASGVLRLHDIGRSGWWILLVLTGFGIILLVYWWCKEKDPVSGNGENKHGLQRPSEDYEIEIPKFVTPAFISGAIVIIILGFILGGFGSSFGMSEPNYSGCRGLAKLAGDMKADGKLKVHY